MLDGPAREIKLLLDHREGLIGERTRIQNRLRWLLHDRWPELALPTGCLDGMSRLEQLARRLARCQQEADVRVMRQHGQTAARAHARSPGPTGRATPVAITQQPSLLELPGVGALTAAKLIAEIAGIQCFTSSAKLARLAGIAPIPASSGNNQRSGCTAAATARSTPRATASPSPRCACTHPRSATSPERPQKATASAKPCAASNAASSAPPPTATPLPSTPPPSHPA
jgi:transposase